MVVIAGAVFGTVAFLELRTSRDLLGFVEGFERSGGYVAVVVPAEGSTVDASVCEGLNELDFVVSAGALMATELTSFTAAPGLLFQRAPISQGILEVWAPGRRIRAGDGRPALVAGAALADELGLRPGSFLQPVGGAPTEIVAVVDTQKRNPQASRWALEIVPPVGSVEACWVELSRDAYEAGIGTLPAFFAGGDEPPIVRRYRRRDEFTRDPLAEFRARPQRLGWVAAAGPVVGTFWLMTWFRRSELGLYLALGTGRATVATMLAVEAMVILTLAYVLGVAYGFALDAALHHEPGFATALLAVRTSISAALLAAALAPLGALLFVRGTIADLLKDR